MSKISCKKKILGDAKHNSKNEYVSNDTSDNNVTSGWLEDGEKERWNKLKEWSCNLRKGQRIEESKEVGLKMAIDIRTFFPREIAIVGMRS